MGRTCSPNRSKIDFKWKSIWAIHVVRIEVKLISKILIEKWPNNLSQNLILLVRHI